MNYFIYTSHLVSSLLVIQYCPGEISQVHTSDIMTLTYTCLLLGCSHVYRLCMYCTCTCLKCACFWVALWALAWSCDGALTSLTEYTCLFKQLTIIALIAVISSLTCKRGERVNCALYWPSFVCPSKQRNIWLNSNNSYSVVWLLVFGI